MKNEKYLNYIRQQDCCYCGAPPNSDPHHVGAFGSAKRNYDELVVPMCRKCHNLATDNKHPLPRFQQIAMAIDIYRDWLDKEVTK